MSAVLSMRSRDIAVSEHHDSNHLVVGHSAGWVDAIKRATLVAPTEATVLLQGESGTGKEVMARLIHARSPRGNRPFVAINCAALPENLLESELFGYERGAFTGAQQTKPGQVEIAAGGVLFLDEVSEMSLAAQAKLLRFLQEREFQRLGGTRVVKTNVRIVAATNRDLAQRVEQGAFRPDLLHRLNVLPLHIPPLRQRREDIRPLVDHFVAMHASSFGRPCPTLTDEVVEALEKLELPGNVRQLENIVRRALVNHTSSAALRLGDLPPEVWREVATDGSEGLSAPSSGATPCPAQDLELQVRVQFHQLIDSTGRLDRSLEFCERVLIALALERTHGNQSETARLLQITPRSVYNKLRKYHLRFPPASLTALVLPSGLNSLLLWGVPALM